MQFGERYKVVSDSLNVTVMERRINTGAKGAKAENIGKEYWIPLAYFSCVGNALKWIVDKEIADTGLEDLQTVVDKISELHRVIDDLKLDGVGVGDC